MLTDTLCKNAKPKEKPYRLADEKGLYLEVMPTGSKYFRLKYRFGGKEKRLALGVYPETSLKDARQKRDEARQLLSQGIDPSEQCKAMKSAQTAEADTFEVIAREWWAKFQPAWAPSHAEYTSRRKNHAGRSSLCRVVGGSGTGVGARKPACFQVPPGFRGGWGLRLAL
ncbi:MAG: Arm DNA-binding domain-containing protein [Methylococcaceae bacterium]|nr:Arm DNA-binding domain-containing protein [Methylococcaceae bacterium]